MDSESIPYSEITFKTSRSSGPGGQNVNKVNSKVQLRWNVIESGWLKGALRERFLELYSSRLLANGTLVIQSESSRDQGKNKRDCIKKLMSMLYAASKPKKVRTKTKPTYSSKVKRVETKRKQSQTKNFRRKVVTEED